MKYFDSDKNVNDYIKMAKGYNGRELVRRLKTYLKDNASVLELGMGPGVDLDILKKNYKVTGSDNSSVFLDLYRSKHRKARLLNLDAVTIDTKRKFKCIYSNKVLHHLTKSRLHASLRRQNKVLLKNGIVLHSFWNGDKTEKYNDLLFVYYTVAQLSNIFERYFNILEIKTYKEMKKNDSIYIIAETK